jgi:hypothetical protein
MRFDLECMHPPHVLLHFAFDTENRHSIARCHNLAQMPKKKNKIFCASSALAAPTATATGVAATTFSSALHRRPSPKHA